MSSKKLVAGWRVIHAESRRPVRMSVHHRPDLALKSLYDFIGDNPGHDFLVVDETGAPVPASRLWKMAGLAGPPVRVK